MVANLELNIYHIQFLQLISRLINYQGNFREIPSFLMIKKDTSSHVKEAYPTNVVGRVSCVRLHILFHHVTQDQGNIGPRTSLSKLGFLNFMRHVARPPLVFV